MNQLFFEVLAAKGLILCWILRLPHLGHFVRALSCLAIVICREKLFRQARHR